MAQIKKPTFTEEESLQILKLQQLFHNHFLTPDLLHQLVSLYVRAVEQFSKDYLFMRAYFLDKMQFVLSRPQTMKMLEKVNGCEQNVETIRESIRLTQRLSEKEDERHDKYEFRQENHKHEHVHNYFYDENKAKERNMKINMQMKVMREVQENMKNISKEVDKADKKMEKNEKKIQDIAKNQNNQLEERLAKRKKKLRKKSEIIESHKEGQQEKPVIKVQQLKQAQRQLTNAVERYTIRLTQKLLMNQMEQTPVKGRIKMQNIEEQEDDEREKKQEPVVKEQGRIKTRRVDEEEDESQYW